MKTKKTIAYLLAMAMSVSLLAGCNQTKETNGKVSLAVGIWPDETNPDALKKQNEQKDAFMAANQDINIVPDTYKYDTKTFTMKASANQLPNMFKPWFTEISQLIKGGYAADITDTMKKYGFDKGLNPDLIKMVTGEDGKIYGIPTDAYVLGLYINKAVFKKAGLVNSDGSIMVPDTWQEVAEYSQIIKEKTGKAGLVFPTTNNCGGWQFLNIAWAFGADFVKQRDDGTWQAIFDTQETRNALQYIKDLKWKYNALMDDSVIDQNTMYKYFGSSQGAMILCDPPFSGYSWGLPNEDLYVAKMPAGPKGRFSQMGGNLWMFSKASTPEQIDAGFRWLEFTGFSPEMSDEQLAQYRKTCEQTIANNGVVIERASYDVWTNPETLEKQRAIRQQFANVDYNDYKEYFEAKDVTVKLEPAACAQQLYSIMDKCVQEVITNENADVDKLISEACKDYQVNHLDKM